MILKIDLSENAALVRFAAGHFVAGVIREDELTAALSEITLESKL